MIAEEHVSRPLQYTALVRDEFMRIEAPEITYLVDGILVSGSATLFSAREKAGKGLFLIDLAVCLATGTPFLDCAVMEGPVIYLALEENVSTIQNRLLARDKGYGGYPFHVVRLDGSVEGEEFYLDTAEGITGLSELIEDIQPVLVIIDPLREAHRGRESESDDMAPRLRAVRSLAHQTNTAIIVSHRTSKSEGASRGSTAIRASFDDELLFKREDSETDTDIRGVLRAEGRNLQKVVEHVAFDSLDGRWTVAAAPLEVIPQNTRRRILTELEESGEWLEPQGLADRIPGVKLKTIQNVLSEMMKETPLPFAVDSLVARRGKPRRFHSLRAPLNLVPGDSREDLESQGTKPVNVMDFPRSGGGAGPDKVGSQPGEVLF